jgi:hypothetical protein
MDFGSSFSGEPMGYNPSIPVNPNKFNISMWDNTTNVLADGIIQDVDSLPTYINPGDFEGGSFHIDWRTTSNYTFNVNGTITSFQAPTETPVPEPATMLLFGTALAGFAGSRIWRRKK